MVKAKITIQLKKDILDPQGKAVTHAIKDMNFKGIGGVRIGKYVEMTFENNDREEVEKQTRELCEKLLSNPIMEVYEYTIEENE